MATLEQLQMIQNLVKGQNPQQVSSPLNDVLPGPTAPPMSPLNDVLPPASDEEPEETPAPKKVLDLA